jgi:hypothetical protein
MTGGKETGDALSSEFRGQDHAGRVQRLVRTEAS